MVFMVHTGHTTRKDATGLSRGVLRSLLHHRSNPPVWMPRACPVEYYARCYTTDRTRLSGCHGLVPWSITLVATPPIEPACLDATGLSRGASRSLLNSSKRDAPRGKPVASEHLWS